MGCCSSTPQQGITLENSSAPQTIESSSASAMGTYSHLFHPRELKLSHYSKEDLTKEFDFEVVCITKPELSYIVKVSKHQLYSLTLRDLETQIIDDMQGYMIESFRFLHSTQIERTYQNEKLIRFLDLLPIYIDLSVDETMPFIEIEIPYSQHVIHIPFDATNTLKQIKKRIARQASLRAADFQLVFAGQTLPATTTSSEDYEESKTLADYGISPTSKLIVVLLVDSITPDKQQQQQQQQQHEKQSHTAGACTSNTISAAPNVHLSNLNISIFKQPSNTINYQSSPNIQTLAVNGVGANTPSALPKIKHSHSDVFLEDLSLNNITKNMTKFQEDNNHHTFLENLAITFNQDHESTDPDHLSPYQHLISLQQRQMLKMEQPQPTTIEFNEVHNSTSLKTFFVSSSNNNNNYNNNNNQSNIPMNNVPSPQLGVNIQIECHTSSCALYKKCQVNSIGFGEILLTQKEQLRFACCSSCKGHVFLLGFCFLDCRYRISGIFKKKQKTSSSQLSVGNGQLKKFHDGQWMQTSGSTVEMFNFETETRDWKQIRIRACQKNPRKENMARCSFCTSTFDFTKSKRVILPCSHVFHQNCYNKLQAINSPCIMCIF